MEADIIAGIWNNPYDSGYTPYGPTPGFRYVPPPETPPPSTEGLSVRRLLYILVALPALLVLILDFAVTIPASAYIVYLIYNRTFESWVFYILFPIVINGTLYTVLPLFYITGGALLLYYLFIAAGSTYSSLRSVNAFVRDWPALEKGDFRDYAMIFYAAVSVSIAYVVYLYIFSVPTRTPDFASDPLWFRLFEFQHAAVWEEVISRALLIGVPLWFLAIIRGDKSKRDSLLSYLLGGKGISREGIYLIVLSSAMFSWAHVPGWDIYKAVPTFITGLFLGYAYMKYGIHASILIHFILDYSNVAAEAMEKYTGIPLYIPIAFFFIYAAVMGFVTFGRYALRAMEYANMWKAPQAYLLFFIPVIGMFVNIHLYLSLKDVEGFRAASATVYLVIYAIGLVFLAAGGYLYYTDREHRSDIGSALLLFIGVVFSFPYGYAASPFLWKALSRFYSHY